MLVPASTLQAALKGLAAVGVSRDALLDASGLSTDQLEAPFAMVPVTAIEQVWARAGELDSRSELVIRAGQALPLGSMRLLDTLAVSAPTLDAALSDAVRFFRFATVTLLLSVDKPDRRSLADVRIVIRTAPPFPRLPIGEAWALSVVLSRLRAGVADFELTAASVAPPIGRDVDGCADALGITPTALSISEEHSTASFPARQLDAPVRTADPALYALISSTADQIIDDAYGRSPLTYAIRCALPELLTLGHFNVQHVASRLGLSARSLQRHLAAEDTSFREVLDAHRRDTAKRRLASSPLPLSEIAAEIGYADQAVFSRAFQRWEGMTPSAWRKAHAA
ncbi:MAG: helix-turn-helix domain-containing protein [Bacteroidota bacterium]